MGKLRQSKDYGMFEMHEFNRPLRDTARLEKSMRRHGFLDAYPLHVSKGAGAKLKIKAGHHRFAVAKRLGLPVKYVICDDAATIHELETCVTRWSFSDYLESFCQVGKADYLTVKKYCDETGISVAVAVSMFGGHWAGSGNFQAEFKSGEFKIRETRHAQTIASLTRHIKACGSPVYNAKLLILALSKMLFLPEFDVETFKRRVKSHAHLIQKQANLKEYMLMVEAVYNRQSKEKINLAFLAEEAAKKRNAVAAQRERMKAA